MDLAHQPATRLDAVTEERIVRYAGSVAVRRVRTSRKRARWHRADASKSRRVREHARR